jgi:hypothetical protein
MIQTLTIERFKSIRSLSIPCRKVNVFIGPPDTGKTNILEALYFLSRLGWGWPLDTSLRLRPEVGFEPLFYRQFFDQPFQIAVRLSPPYAGRDEITVSATIEGQDRHLKIKTPQERGGVPFAGALHVPELDWIRFYSYTTSEHWQYSTGYPYGETLVNPPHGYNLLYIARHNAKVYEFLKDTLSGINWKLRFDQSQKTFRLSEIREDEILDYNLDLLSDSLKRLFFYSAIILTSENATLVLDEPDVFAFPPYPKTLGEMIAGDAPNQFFLTTHNPYFLAGIVEKTSTDKLALFVCSRDSEGGTAVKLLTSEEVGRAIEQGANVFFNLDEFLNPRPRSSPMSVTLTKTCSVS